MKKKLVVSHGMKGVLDDDYTLYDNGDVEHFYDQSIYPGGQNKTEWLTAKELSDKVKLRLLDEANAEDKEQVRELLGMKG